MRKLFVMLLLTLYIAPANADGYAIVDENGNQIGGVIVCDAAVCGDPNSLYSRLTLQPGQRYVLQSKTDATGNTVGIQPTENTNIKVDVNTNVWTVETKHTIKPIPEVKVEVTTRETFTPDTFPHAQPVTTTPEPTPKPTIASTPSSSDTATVTSSESQTVTTTESNSEQVTQNNTENSASDTDKTTDLVIPNWWEELVASLFAYFNSIFSWTIIN